MSNTAKADPALATRNATPFTVKVNPHERAIVEKAAKAANKPSTTWIRELMLKAAGRGK